MTEKSEFITFPKTFEKYKWYKPILVFIIGVITYLILSLLLSLIFEVAYGEHLTNSILNGGYEVMNSENHTLLSLHCLLIKLNRNHPMNEQQ